MLTRWLASPALRRATDRVEGLIANEIPVAATGTHSIFSTGITSRNQPIAPRIARMTPTKLTATCVTNPAPRSVSPNAVTIGQGVGAGASILCGTSCLLCSTAICFFLPLLHPAPRRAGEERDGGSTADDIY